MSLYDWARKVTTMQGVLDMKVFYNNAYTLPFISSALKELFREGSEEDKEGEEARIITLN